MSNATLKKIEEAIAESGYAPNVNAKRLRTQKAHSILAIVPDIADPFCATVVQGAENTAADLGYTVLLGDTQGELERVGIYTSMVRSGHVDGLLYLSIREPYELSPFRKPKTRQPPVVYICNYTTDGVPAVGIDNVEAAQKAVEHLLQLGHRRIGVIAASPEHPETLLRLQGYRRALKKRRADLAGELIAYGDFSFDSGIAACERLLNLPEPPTAIFSHNDRMAQGALQALWRRGIDVPRDMSILGFDNLESTRFSCPPLTTVAQPMYEIGANAMKMLFKLMSARRLPKKHQILPAELIIRESTAPPRGAD